MSSPHDLIDRISNLVPHWLGWPMSALSTLTAFTGAGLLFAAAAFASIAAAVWGGVAFGVAAITWHVADIAEANRPF